MRDDQSPIQPITLEPEAPRQQQAWLVYELLLQRYGARELKPRREPMHELISTMLSHRTTGRNEEMSFQRLWQRFGSWEAIRDAPVVEVSEAIAPATFAEAKAPNIQATLGRIIAERGEASIDFLRDVPVAEGMRWLMGLPGVGRKTASLVLLFCFGKPVMPVDTHVHRVSQRTGLIGPKVVPEAAHTILLALLPPEPYVHYNFHCTLLRHGQKVCVWGTPRCEQCPLTQHCDWFHIQRGGSGKKA